QGFDQVAYRCHVARAVVEDTGGFRPIHDLSYDLRKTQRLAMKSLKIFFGDLTHDSIGLATEVFPLNIGFVAAYCKARFGDAVEMQLFKYIGELEDAI